MIHIVAEGDYHSGHRAGLTPPDWWYRPGLAAHARWHAIQKELWERRQGLISAIGKPDRLILMGDLIDGRGERSGGTELVATSLSDQVRMAAEAASQWGADQIQMVRGTDYHTGWGGEDWENFIAEELRTGGTRVRIDDHAFVTIDGVTFDLKHDLGASSIPHGRATAILKERLWNEQWWLDGEGEPLADVILRAHTHYHIGTWGYRGDRLWVAMITPALQAAATKYGQRKCRGVVHWGLVEFWVEDGRLVEWKPHILAIKANRNEAVEW